MKEIADILAKLFNGLSSLTKLFWIIVIFILAFWIDTKMGFTYHYFTERKIGEISKYNEILKDTTLDSVTRTKILQERSIVVSKDRQLFDPIKKHKPHNTFWFHFSYSFLFIFLMVLCYPLLRNQNPYTLKSQLQSQTIAVAIILSFELFIIYFIARLLSQYLSLAASIIINYILGIIFLAFTFWAAFKFEKKPKIEV